MSRSPIVALSIAGVACGVYLAAAHAGAATQERFGLVDSATPRWSSTAGWVVAQEPATVIGNDQGPEPYLLYQVETALLLPDGGVVVASAGSHDLRYFAPDGAHRRTVGGRGQGPGEFEWPRWMGRIDGEHILVWDGPNSRIHIFGITGALIRTTAIDPTIPPSMSANGEFPGRPMVIGAFPDAALVVTPAFPTAYLTSRSSGTHRITTPLVLYSSEGSAEARLADLEGDEHAVHQGSSMHLPFGHRLHAAVGHDRIYAGSGKPYEITVLDRRGNELGRIRRSYGVREVDAAVRRQYRDRFLERISAGSRRDAEEGLDAIEFPAEFPAYDALLVDSEGNLWSRDYEWPREGAVHWSVFEPSGAWLGTVSTPAGVEVTDIGGSRIVGLSEDEAGVEHVVVYDLIKPR